MHTCTKQTCKIMIPNAYVNITRFGNFHSVHIIIYYIIRVMSIDDISIQACMHFLLSMIGEPENHSHHLPVTHHHRPISFLDGILRMWDMSICTCMVSNDRGFLGEFFPYMSVYECLIGNLKIL